MLGLSIGKILVIIGVVLAVWRGLKMVTALRDRLDLQEKLRAQRERETTRAAARPTELVECPKCGTFVPNGTICLSKEQCRLKPAA